MLATGSWVHHEEISPIVAVAKLPDSRCADPPFSQTTRPGLWYHWENPTCPLRMWSPTEFCKLMNGSNILIVGDSMNYMFHNVFVSALWDDSVNSIPVGEGQHSSSPFLLCQREAVVDPSIKPFYLQFRRNDKVDLSDDDPSSYTGREPYFCYDWKNYISPDYKIIIINRGAHFEEDDFYISQMKQTLTYLRTRHPSLLVVFRNTPVGHDDKAIEGGKFKYPLASRHPMSDVGRTYHWDRFEMQNRKMRDLIRNEFPGVIYLDVDTPTSLRPDNHRDGLHYCIPGPVDWWLSFLHHALVLLNDL
jgi:hypothetical protein